MNQVASATIDALLRQISEALASPHTSIGTDAAPGTVPRSRAGNGLAPLAGIRLWRVNRGLGGWSN